MSAENLRREALAQRGEARAEYGEEVIEDLSHQLLSCVGRGYSTRNLWWIDEAKILHEAGAEFAQDLSSRLSWSHYRALLKVSDPAARTFYEIEAA